MFYIREGVNIKDNDVIFFFDIDQTFGNSVDTFYLNTEENFNKTKKILDNLNISGTYINDTMHLSKSSLMLFSELVKATNAKCICVSSWGNRKNPEESLDIINKIFNLFAPFPNKEEWLIGVSGGNGGDRYGSYIKPIIESIDKKINYIVIDDGFHQYSNQERCLKVDGRLGFNIYNLVEAVTLLDISHKLFSYQISFHIKTILKED